MRCCVALLLSLALAGCSAPTPSNPTLPSTAPVAGTPVALRTETSTPPQASRTPQEVAPAATPEGSGTPEPAATSPEDTRTPSLGVATPAYPVHAPQAAASSPLDIPAVAPSPQAVNLQGSHKAVTEAEIGAPFYPGAKQLGGGRMETNTGGLIAAILTADLETPDPIAKVSDFYKAKLPRAKRTEIKQEGYIGVMYQAAEPSALEITINRSGKGPTTITLVNRTKLHATQP